jgi:hypothetical protein
MGLFDRPADVGCLAALRGEPIAGLTEPLAGLGDDDWEFCLSGLEAAKLLTVHRDATGALLSLDAHPHLREYFAQHLREKKSDAWRAAHRRLYEYLCATTKEGDEPTLEDLQPLYQAVAHGCQAGLQKQACDQVYQARILRGREFHSTRKLGAYGSDLGAVACFFETPWNRASTALSHEVQGRMLNHAGFRLRALGRLTDAREPMRLALEMGAKTKDWVEAAIRAGHLSELELTLGEVTSAVEYAEQAVTYADCGGKAFQPINTRTTHADALHQSGHRAEAEALFREAERRQAESQPHSPRLCFLQGFRYCDLLLAAPERAIRSLDEGGTRTEELLNVCRSVSRRAAQTLKIAEDNNRLLDIALDRLTLGRAALFEAILDHSDLCVARSGLDAAVSGLRSAGDSTRLPRGLLTRAWLRALTGARTGPESAQADLDEAWEIAARGPMPLHMADIHLYRARLFYRELAYPWESPAADLAAAEKLIAKCGYHRRDGELADAKAAILGAK